MRYFIYTVIAIPIGPDLLQGRNGGLENEA